MTDLAAIKRYFWERVILSDDHWLWTGTHDSDGYGQCRLRAWRHRAHRTSWIIHYGSIPVGVSVLHHCDQPLCVRPNHLFLGTQADNLRDMASKGRGRNQNTGKTTCPRGHAYDYIAANGKRHCKRCGVERRRAARAACRA